MGNSYDIAVIPGDGTGPEVTREAEKVLNVVASAYNFKLNFHHYPYSGAHYIAHKELLPDSAVDEFRDMQGILFGTLGHPEVEHGTLVKEILMKIRISLDQYVYVRPVKLLPGIPAPLKGKGPEDIDFVIVRENTGGLYAGVGGSMMKWTPREVATESMVYTRHQVERCVEYAFQYAAKRNTGKPLVLAGKTSVLTHVYDLWERVFRDIGNDSYPQQKRHYHPVDELCMLMVKNPEMFDVVVTGNIFGDILGDLGAVIQGGVGLAASGNINPDGVSMFSPIGGRFSEDIWSEHLVNPLSAIMAASMLLENIGELEASQRVESAVMQVTGTRLPSVQPGSLGYGTAEVGDMVAELI